MCGRFALNSEPGIIKSQFNVEVMPLLEPNYNASPTEPILFLTETADGVRRGELFRWGLVPFFSKAILKSRPLINARSETVENSPAFRQPFKGKRGMVVMDGFFEWTDEGGIRQPWYICRKDKKLMAIASLWDSWEAPRGEIIHSCCMITTPPNELLAPFHDRMPALIDRNGQDIWMDSECRDVALLKQCLKPCEGDELMMYRVTRRVGSPYFKNKAAIVPLVDK